MSHIGQDLASRANTGITSGSQESVRDIERQLETRRPEILTQNRIEAGVIEGPSGQPKAKPGKRPSRRRGTPRAFPYRRSSPGLEPLSPGLAPSWRLAELAFDKVGSADDRGGMIYRDLGRDTIRLNLVDGRLALVRSWSQLMLRLPSPGLTHSEIIGRYRKGLD
jgi:hypothetical protein